VTALAAARSRFCQAPIGQVHADRYWGFKGDTGKVYPGAIMIKVAGEHYVQKASAVSGAMAVGVYNGNFPIDTTGKADGEVGGLIIDGIWGYFDTGTSANQVTADLIHQTIYVKDDNTLWATDDSGNLDATVRLHMVSSEGLQIIFGPSGPAGPTGATGATGATGPTGPAGP
jgi:hypothetical protein